MGSDLQEHQIGTITFRYRGKHTHKIEISLKKDIMKKTSINPQVAHRLSSLIYVLIPRLFQGGNKQQEVTRVNKKRMMVFQRWWKANICALKLSVGVGGRS